MASHKESTGSIKHTIQRAGYTSGHAASSRLVVWLARLGYATKGLIYFVIGTLAIQLALGLGGNTTDQRGALQALATLPSGQIVLIISALGLFGFALWGLLQAILDTEAKGHDAKGIIARLGYAVTAISYALLGIGAFHLATSTGNVGQNTTTSTQDWTARLLQQPFGIALVMLLGLGVIGLGIFLYIKAYQAHFLRHLNLATVSRHMRQTIRFLGRFGYAALGTVFGIIGIFLIIAALQHNPQQAKGLDSALRELIHQPLGPLWLALVAFGFIAYGIYSLVEARYRRVGQNRTR